MKNPFATPFAAVFANEVLLGTKRVAPYVLMAFFAANCILWWGWGPAVKQGWATNCDFYIKRNMGGFSFLWLPIITGIFMGDVVIRDFRLGVDPLIFSKPVGRGSYVFGKFLGNYFVFLCCLSAFPITFFLLQWVPFSGMVKSPVTVVPFVKHFFIIVVVSHLGLAAIYFTAGTLSRNAKVVYGLAASFYPAYIAAQLLFLSYSPKIFNILLDPLGFNLGKGGLMSNPWGLKADVINSTVSTYGLDQIANRAWVITATALLLVFVYRRFRIDPLTTYSKGFTILTLAETQEERIAYSAPFGLTGSGIRALPARERISLPKVTSTVGPATTQFKILAAMGVEFQLLRAERGLVVLVPLVVLASFLNFPTFRVVPEINYAVTYATNVANTLLFLLMCMLVFYIGESMHRDREVKIEPVVWSTPAPNSVFLLPKFLVMTLVCLALVAVVSVLGFVTQVYRDQTPFDLRPYFFIYVIVVVPSIAFVSAMVILLNVLLRNKYLVYVVATGMGAGLIYFYNNSHDHWLYNPLLYGLWKYPTLTNSNILGYRLYCLGLTVVCLLLAHILFQRKSR